jgi:thioester reductase-like protein
VRASGINHARQRLVDTLESYGLWKSDYALLLNAVVGDMARPLLGLSKEVFDDLADRVDAICHSGALVDWMRPMEDYVGPNILSTQEVLRLASCSRGKAVHLVSTVATVPRYLGYDVSENEYEYGYATSKFMAERLVAAARWRGARASVYRMPFVTASSSNGHFRLDRGDFLHNLIAGSIEMGSFPSLDGNLSMVLPVDYLCKTVVSIVTQDLSRIGQDFDFANTHAPTFNYFFKLMVAARAGHEVVPFSRWREQALAYAAAHPTSPLARIAAVLDGCNNEIAGAMFKTPLLGEHVFGDSEYPVPPMNKQFVQKYIDQIRAM